MVTQTHLKLNSQTCDRKFTRETYIRGEIFYSVLRLPCLAIIWLLRNFWYCRISTPTSSNRILVVKLLRRPTKERGPSMLNQMVIAIVDSKCSPFHDNVSFCTVYQYTRHDDLLCCNACCFAINYSHSVLPLGVSLVNIRLLPSSTSDFYVTVSYKLNASITNPKESVIDPSLNPK